MQLQLGHQGFKSRKIKITSKDMQCGEQSISNANYTQIDIFLESQNTNCGDAVEFPADDSAPLFAPSLVSADRLNGVLSPGDDGIATFGLPIQSPDIVPRYAMRSQMDYTVNEDVLPTEPPYAPTSSHQWSGTFAPRPEGNHVMGDFQFNGADDWVDYLLASLEEDDDTSLQTTPWGDGYVWGQQRC
ncbi:hypothetical protein NL676_007947 [Syzygium grande]|nr:hypothetical protein NL676_007947 [Syzygium grande]